MNLKTETAFQRSPRMDSFRTKSSQDVLWNDSMSSSKELSARVLVIYVLSLRRTVYINVTSYIPTLTLLPPILRHYYPWSRRRRRFPRQAHNDRRCDRLRVVWVHCE